MTQFQKLCKGAEFVTVGRYHMFAMLLDDLIAKLPFANKDLLMVRSAYHLVRLSQTSYAIALILGDDEYVAEAKEILDSSMRIWNVI